MNYQIISIYIVLCCILGIQGWLFSTFIPELSVEKNAANFSIAFFIMASASVIWLAMSNKNILIVKFRRPLNFYFFTFAGIPLLLALLSFLNFGAWSRAIPSFYTLATTEPDIISSEITSKRLWGRNDRRREIFISGYREGLPVSMSYYRSVNIGQTIKIAVRKSKLGTHLEFL